jgi:bifunctional DNA-binding transcriptional regulator/antitoxin component of YhaV-PrlF toxin-antitoxin module
MITTIDQAGRVVIPKVLRDKHHLVAPTEVEMVSDGEGIKLRLPQRASTFKDKDGILVQSTGSVAEVDATHFINQMRESQALAGQPGTDD